MKKKQSMKIHGLIQQRFAELWDDIACTTSSSSEFTDYWFNFAFFFDKPLIIDHDENLRWILTSLDCICDTMSIKPIIDLWHLVHIITCTSKQSTLAAMAKLPCSHLTFKVFWLPIANLLESNRFHIGCRGRLSTADFNLFDIICGEWWWKMLKLQCLRESLGYAVSSMHLQVISLRYKAFKLTLDQYTSSNLYNIV